jgi:hypothetical protein
METVSFSFSLFIRIRHHNAPDTLIPGARMNGFLLSGQKIPCWLARIFYFYIKTL